MAENIVDTGIIQIKSRDVNNLFNNSRVRELSPTDFNAICGLKSKKCTFIMFYAPWCGYCKRTVDTWNRLANVSEFMDVCAFNCERYSDFAAQMNCTNKGIKFIPSYPTLKLYKDGKFFKDYPTDERTLEKLLKFAMNNC